MRKDLIPIDSVSHRLKEAMAIRGLQPVDLVDMTGIPKSSISHYMSGRAEPKQNRLYSLSEALNVQPTWLMGLDVPMENANPVLAEYAKRLLSLMRNNADDLITVDYYIHLPTDQKRAISLMIETFYKTNHEEDSTVLRKDDK